MNALIAASNNPLWHVVQIPLSEDVWFITNHIIIQLLAGLLTILLIPAMLRQRAGGDEVGRLVPRRWGNAIEAICVALRDNVAKPSLEEHTNRFLPFIWTVFFFVLFQNLMGMLPLAVITSLILPGHWFHGHGIGGAPTGNIWVTGTLAGITLILIVYNGLTQHGMKYVSHFFMGPFPINLLIGVLEIIGVIFKAFALTVRLFANMIAGHILLAVLLSFIGLAATGLGTGGGAIIAVPVVIMSVLINLLELFVAFLQAFIFTFLTAMFIGQAVNIHHHGEDDHSHAHEHLAVAADDMPVHAHRH